ncbi:MAG: lactate racemase domain-containing protein [Desulfobacterota bacterium]|nr:lactate racemase domain-containing protein [Thermodesulfobacteriota bacterium]
MVKGIGSPDHSCMEEEVRTLLEEGTPVRLFDRKRVLVLTPDATRTCPLPMMIRSVVDVIGARAAKLDFMVALGTHTPLDQKDILKLYGIDSRRKMFRGIEFFNHEWDRQESFARIGTFTQEEVEDLSEGRLKEKVPLVINKRIFDYDLVLIVGPVFPHEVVGYSGGAKYLFPGISGGDFLHFFHWLGAVITCKNIIGIKDTTVRRAIDKAMEKVPVPVHCVAMVVNENSNLCGLYVGHVREAWSKAAELSSQVHVKTKKKPFRVVLGRAPAMYDEIWTAGKVMYKLEQVVADQGTLIIYGPHIREISRTWGKDIERIGYHTRDYFLAQMERFGDIPRGVLAHSTHVRGTGTYEKGVEKPHVNVVLATSIPRETCDRINLGYMDPSGIRLSDYMGREEEGILFVDHAGEILYRLEKTE